MNNVTVVTQPDCFYADQPVFLFLVDPAYAETVVDVLNRHDKDLTVYFARPDCDHRWFAESFAQCDYCVIDAGISDFFTGLVIDKSKTYYYNNSMDLKMYNLNTVADPVEFVLAWIDTEQ